MKPRSTEEHKKVRREFRKNPTPAEEELWKHLRKKQLKGYKFRRQHPVKGKFILDFYCPIKKLAIGLDGPIHRFTKKEDKERQELIESIGIKVVRFKNRDVFDRVEWILEKIVNALEG
ncbi:endonuclease domain-containing protein [bacterium]|nr:endonuclease domain-containing protein [bacterium]